MFSKLNFDSQYSRFYEHLGEDCLEYKLFVPGFDKESIEISLQRASKDLSFRNDFGKNVIYVECKNSHEEIIKDVKFKIPLPGIYSLSNIDDTNIKTDLKNGILSLKIELDKTQIKETIVKIKL